MKNILLGLSLIFTGHGAAADGAANVGKPAPIFTAKNQDDKTVDMKDYFGKKSVLLYFYPKDDSPGCTKEACHFRDDFESLKAKGLVIFGLSTQSAASHKDFQNKFHLPFDLLVDKGGAIAKSFGVSKYPVVGLLKRESVLIGKDGNILKFYENVDPETHAQQVAQDLQAAAK